LPLVVGWLVYLAVAWLAVRPTDLALPVAGWLAVPTNRLVVLVGQLGSRKPCDPAVWW
jgi:hypothetical protein